MKLNDIQKTLLRGYAAGDHAWLAEQEEVTVQDLSNEGDSLIRFLLQEAGPQEECTDVEQAIARLNNVINDIFGAINALESADPEPTISTEPSSAAATKHKDETKRVLTCKGGNDFVLAKSALRCCVEVDDCAVHIHRAQDNAVVTVEISARGEPNYVLEHCQLSQDDARSFINGEDT